MTWPDIPEPERERLIRWLRDEAVDADNRVEHGIDIAPSDGPLIRAMAEALECNVRAPKEITMNFREYLTRHYCKEHDASVVFALREGEAFAVIEYMTWKGDCDQPDATGVERHVVLIGNGRHQGAPRASDDVHTICGRLRTGHRDTLRALFLVHALRAGAAHGHEVGLGYDIERDEVRVNIYLARV